MNKVIIEGLLIHIHDAYHRMFHYPLFNNPLYVWKKCEAWIKDCQVQFEYCNREKRL